jgi:hypothetical protein
VLVALEAVVGDVQDTGDGALAIEHDDVAVGDAPAPPRVFRRGVLEPCDVAAVGDGVVAGLPARFVDAVEGDGLTGVGGRDGVEVAKLATAVASRRVPEVPDTHLSSEV